MAKRNALIENETWRHAVIAAVMLTVFAASIGMAYLAIGPAEELVTAQRLVQAQRQDWLSRGFVAAPEAAVGRMRLRAFVDSMLQGRGPIYLMPANQGDPRRVVRLLLTPDAMVSDAHHQLSPQQVLTQRFRTLTGRAPSSEEIWGDDLASRHAWAVSAGGRSHDLRPTLWFVRLGNGQALLIEVLAAGGSFADQTRWLEPLVASLVPKGQPLNADAQVSSHVQAMLETGRTLAARQSDLLEQRAGDVESLNLIHRAGQVIGFHLEQVRMVRAEAGRGAGRGADRGSDHGADHAERESASGPASSPADSQSEASRRPSAAEPPMVLQGRALQRTITAPPAAFAARWRSSLRGDQYRIGFERTHWIFRNLRQKAKYELVRDQNELSLIVGASGRVASPWSMSVPRPFVAPLHEAHWDVEWLMDQPAPPPGVGPDHGREAAEDQADQTDQVIGDDGASRRIGARVGEDWPRALVWMQPALTDPPALCWIQVRRHSVDVQVRAEAAYELTIRSAGVLDARRLILDETGKVISSIEPGQIGGARIGGVLGGSETAVTEVDRDQLFSELPQMQSVIEDWLEHGRP